MTSNLRILREAVANRTTAPTNTATAVTTITSNPTSLTPLADASEFNLSFDWEATTGLPTYIVDLIGTEPRDKIVLPHGANEPGTVAWQLDSGRIIDVGTDGVITFGFFDHRHAVGQTNNPSQPGIVYGEGQGYTPFTEAQKVAARVAIQNWDDLVAPEFVEQNLTKGVKEWAQNTTDIWLANTYTGPAQAWAYYPGGSRITSDVWIADPRFNGSNFQLDPGFYGLQTLNHELGHSLGLTHPGSYDFGDDQDGDGQPDPISYTGDAQYFQDSHQFTIMSYFDSYETGAQPIDWNMMRLLYPSTPMVDDVFVIQQKYGAEMNTRTGDTTYGFNATADVTNEAMRFNTGELATIFTIWDAAGNDTLNLSGYYTDSVIDLREGAYSSAGGWGAYNPALLDVDPTLALINANNAAGGLPNRTARLFELYFNGDWSDDGGKTFVNEGLSWKEITGTSDKLLLEQNIGIAYGALIENAVGGHGNDRINGNQANNVFTGNAGADTFIIADYSGTLPGFNGTTRTITDTSVDTITDFSSLEGDKIDLTSFAGVDFADLSYDAATHTLTIDRDGAPDVQLILLNVASVAEADFIFG